MAQLFEDYLKEVHAQSYRGLDDDMPDAYDAWVSELSTEQLMAIAENAAQNAFTKGVEYGSKNK